mmetsp:Transcript_4117/g.14387  ORF Transcript_4117/g.14387 Transcript_4117/m.14387 type:complete len:210 (-) Transcript_4117:1611-2240(-)
MGDELPRHANLNMSFQNQAIFTQTKSNIWPSHLAQHAPSRVQELNSLALLLQGPLVGSQLHHAGLGKPPGGLAGQDVRADHNLGLGRDDRARLELELGVPLDPPARDVHGLRLLVGNYQEALARESADARPRILLLSARDQTLSPRAVCVVELLPPLRQLLCQELLIALVDVPALPHLVVQLGAGPDQLVVTRHHLLELAVHEVVHQSP